MYNVHCTYIDTNVIIRLQKLLYMYS